MKQQMKELIESNLKATHEIMEEQTNQAGLFQEAMKQEYGCHEYGTKRKISRLLRFLDTMKPALVETRDLFNETTTDLQDLTSQVNHLQWQRSYERKDITKIGTATLKLADTIRKAFQRLTDVIPEECLFNDLEDVIAELEDIQALMSTSNDEET